MSSSILVLCSPMESWRGGGGGRGVLVAHFIRLIIIMEKHNTEHIMYIEMEKVISNVTKTNT